MLSFSSSLLEFDLGKRKKKLIRNKTSWDGRKLYYPIYSIRGARSIYLQDLCCVVFLGARWPHRVPAVRHREAATLHFTNSETVTLSSAGCPLLSGTLVQLGWGICLCSIQVCSARGEHGPDYRSLCKWQTDGAVSSVGEQTCRRCASVALNLIWTSIWSAERLWLGFE